jgi:hypothetical protein
MLAHSFAVDNKHLGRAPSSIIGVIRQQSTARQQTNTIENLLFCKYEQVSFRQ